MVLILQLILSVKISICEALSYIFKSFSIVAGLYLTLRFIYLRKSRSQITSSCTEERCSREVKCWSVSKISQSEMKVNASLKNSKNNEGLNKKNYASRSCIPQKTNRFMFGDSKQNENEVTQTINELYEKNYTNINKQLYCNGDIYNSLKPLVSFFEPEANLKGRIGSKMSNKGREKNKTKINTVSKYTISLMNNLNTKSDSILRLLDEMNNTPSTISQQLHEDVSKDFGPRNSFNNVRNGSEETEYKPLNHLTSGMRSPTGTEDKKLKAESLYCLETHCCCLIHVDSDDDVSYIVRSSVLTPKYFAYDVDYAMQNELLTPEELASVELGSDDDWLYKPMQSELIPVTA